MKAEYNHWYKCQKGQMPEDFENAISEDVIINKGRKRIDIDCRTSYCRWKRHRDSTVFAWMLPEPYKE